jgi:hypothetical protein
MKQLNCCRDAEWTLVLDLPSASGFEYVLGKCRACGTPWMNVFCVASSITGFERISPNDVEKILTTTDYAELKQFVRSWGDAHL